jgi:hypothetical protein
MDPAQIPGRLAERFVPKKKRVNVKLRNPGMPIIFFLHLAPPVAAAKKTTLSVRMH